ncbi:hypothetical protein D9Q98_003293 [Chlorella vulgaris]|uniref:Uncharacterized protein n=1 Tax=Chlorella vulgaris TaxID=3077 RepID=A0A9D4TSL5_CHLVU|nr:hypothetical protein D9Q98_003293 [Chlorella vulgaris]
MVRLLLAVDPSAAVVADGQGMLPVHRAAGSGHTATCKLLMATAPHTAVVPDAEGRTPLQCALDGNDDDYFYNYKDPPHLDAARCFIAAGPAAAALAALSAVPQALPLFADFFIARSTHLTSEEWKAAWSAVPAPCPGLMRALPAVLAHSAQQAGHLVQHLPPTDVQRLRTAALCLSRAQKQSSVCLLDIVQQILLLMCA